MVSERGVLGVGPLLAGQAARCRVGSPRVVLAVRRDVLAFQSWNTATTPAEATASPTCLTVRHVAVVPLGLGVRGVAPHPRIT